MAPTTSVAGRGMALEGNVVGETVAVIVAMIETALATTTLARVQTRTLDK